MNYLCAKIITVAALAVAIVGCRRFPAYFSGDKIIAEAAGNDLLLHDIENVIPKGISGKDSLDFVSVYIDRWVRRQLKLQQAETFFSDSTDDIDKMVAQYRQDLLVRKLDRYYVDRNIDTLFADSQITAYYNAHKLDFKLDRTVVKGCIVSFDKSFRLAKRLRTAMNGASDAQQQDFRDISAKNGLQTENFGGGWVDFTTFLGNLPTLRNRNYDPLLTKSGVQELDDGQTHYLFRIDAVRRTGEPTPLSLTRDMIRRVLFNKRQEEIIRKNEDDLYQKAMQKGEVKIFGADSTKGSD